MPTVTETRHLRSTVVRRLEDECLVAVVRTPTTQQAVQLARALFDGGVTCLEITLTVPDATDAIAELRRNSPAALVGAGSVVDRATAERCLAAGAQFVVSPAAIEALVQPIQEQGAAAILGALTPTEVVSAANAEADFVKLFPISAMGGAAYLKALRGPLPHVKYAPTGGVHLQTLNDYVAAGASLLGVGGALADHRLLEREGEQAVSALARRYTEALAVARRG